MHEVWLRGQRFDLPGLQLAYDAAFEAVLLTTASRARLAVVPGVVGDTLGLR